MSVANPVAIAPMISLNNVSRWYGQVIGLNDVSFDLPAGLTALLGPNGAGKSTLLKLVTGQLKPRTGTVNVLQQNPFANPDVMRQLGYCPEVDNFYEEMTGREFVRLLAAMHGFRGSELGDRVDRAIDDVGMSDRADRKLGGFSKGMRQRIKVAQAIVHDPSVIVLDEPLNGLDPVGRRDMVDRMHTWSAAGKCVVVSSHVLYEVEQITDRILVIYKGRLLAQGDISTIRAQIDRYPHHIEIVTDQPRALGQALLNCDSVLAARVRRAAETGRGELLEIETDRPETFYDDLARVATDGSFTIEQFHSPNNNLEAVFRYLVPG